MRGVIILRREGAREGRSDPPADALPAALSLVPFAAGEDWYTPKLRGGVNSRSGLRCEMEKRVFALVF